MDNLYKIIGWERGFVPESESDVRELIEKNLYPEDRQYFEEILLNPKNKSDYDSIWQDLSDIGAARASLSLESNPTFPEDFLGKRKRARGFVEFKRELGFRHLRKTESNSSDKWISIVIFAVVWLFLFFVLALLRPLFI